MNDNPVESQSNGVIAEIRTYRIKAGRREEFLRYFDTNIVPLQRSKGIAITGPFRDIENSDTIVWLRTFPSFDDRKRMLDAFYESDEWNSGSKRDHWRYDRKPKPGGCTATRADVEWRRLIVRKSGPAAAVSPCISNGNRFS